ncbi:unnamed protein product [Prorocentrum cordatum]|uniref:Uncharacterized protein n=1 Tax=Prorocentrum cordatum TaxID=2364126 RepID=A0ABN9SQ32_9DINO|nr:unnamed protein product [Polarella glacialis]
MAGKAATLSAERSAFAWIPASPNDKRPAHGNAAREVKGHKLSRRWSPCQEYFGWKPTGNRATFPTRMWWAYVSRQVGQSDFSTEMDALGIFDWDTTDPEARVADRIVDVEFDQRAYRELSEVQIRNMWHEPPEFTVYDPDLFNVNEVDVRTDERAMRAHLTEVGQFRPILVRELNILKARREMLELAHRDIYRNRSDLPQVSTEAHRIEACMQYLLQSHATAIRRGQRATLDTFQHAAVELWPLHVYEDRAKTTVARAVMTAGQIAVATTAINGAAAADGTGKPQTSMRPWRSGGYAGADACTLGPWPHGAHHVAGGAAGGCESLAPALFDTLGPWPHGALHVAGGAAGGYESLAPAPARIRALQPLPAAALVAAAGAALVAEPGADHLGGVAGPRPRAEAGPPLSARRGARRRGGRAQPPPVVVVAAVAGLAAAAPARGAVGLVVPAGPPAAVGGRARRRPPPRRGVAVAVRAAPSARAALGEGGGLGGLVLAALEVGVGGGCEVGPSPVLARRQLAPRTSTEAEVAPSEGGASRGASRLAGEDCWAAKRKLRQIDDGNGNQYLSYEEVQQIVNLDDTSLLFVWDIFNQQDEFVETRELLTALCVFSAASLSDKGRFLASLFDSLQCGLNTGAELAQLCAGVLGVLARCTNTASKPKDVALMVREDLPTWVPVLQDEAVSFEADRVIGSDELDEAIGSLRSAYGKTPLYNKYSVTSQEIGQGAAGGPTDDAFRMGSRRASVMSAAPPSAPVRVEQRAAPGMAGPPPDQLAHISWMKKLESADTANGRSNKVTADALNGIRAEAAIATQDAAHIWMIMPDEDFASIAKELAAFRQMFVKSVSVALGLPSECVEVVNVTQGSVVVDVILRPAGSLHDTRTAWDLVHALEQQIANPHSALRKGPLAHRVRGAEILTGEPTRVVAGGGGGDTADQGCQTDPAELATPRVPAEPDDAGEAAGAADAREAAAYLKEALRELQAVRQRTARAEAATAAVLAEVSQRDALIEELRAQVAAS